MKKLFVLLSLFVACCSNFVDDSPRYIDYDDSQPWIQTPLDGAISFWEEHDVYFIQVGQEPEIGIIVDDVLGATNHYAIAYWSGVDGVGYINLDQTLPEYPIGYQTCVLAHEMGHSLGMNHDDMEIGKSLMAGTAQLVDETKCPWSELDQRELDRVYH